jgi:hypothetical protein
MVDLIYPKNYELTKIAQELTPRLEENRPIFSIFPTETMDAAVLAWEQEDDWFGLQQARGLNGQPTRIRKLGAKRYEMQPGFYGEYEYINEEELMGRRQFGSVNAVIDLKDIVVKSNARLLGREVDRREQLLWTLLTTGTFSVQGPTGAVVHTDVFPLQTMTPTTPWSNRATSTPLADLQVLSLQGRGRSVNYGTGATVWVNRTTANNLVGNTNAADLGGRRLGLGTTNNLGEVNSMLTGDGLATIVVYDQGYKDDTGTFQLFIPNGKGVAIGQRPAGQRIGEYRILRNVNNADFAAGSYSKVIDRVADSVPRTVEVHRGHNGGPVIYFGSAITIMNI